MGDFFFRPSAFVDLARFDGGRRIFRQTTPDRATPIHFRPPMPAPTHNVPGDAGNTDERWNERRKPTVCRDTRTGLGVFSPVQTLCEKKQLTATTITRVVFKNPKKKLVFKTGAFDERNDGSLLRKKNGKGTKRDFVMRYIKTKKILPRML